MKPNPPIPPEFDEMPPPPTSQVARSPLLEANCGRSSQTNEMAAYVSRKNRFRNLVADWGLSLGVILLVGGLIGGCWWSVQHAHTKQEARRKAKEAAEQAEQARRVSQFEAFAKDHNAITFDLPLLALPGAELTADFQRKLTGSQPVAISLMFPDVRISDGLPRLCSNDLWELSGLRFELEINEAQIAVVREASSQQRGVWIIAKIESTDAKMETRTSDSGPNSELVVKCVGKTIQCRMAGD